MGVSIIWRAANVWSSDPGCYRGFIGRKVELSTINVGFPALSIANNEV